MLSLEKDSSYENSNSHSLTAPPTFQFQISIYSPRVTPAQPTYRSQRISPHHSAVSPILADRDKNNCAEQMHDSHPSSRIRPLDQSEVVRTVGCSCPDRPESGRLQYLRRLQHPTHPRDVKCHAGMWLAVQKQLTVRVQAPRNAKHSISSHKYIACINQNPAELSDTSSVCSCFIQTVSARRIFS